MNKVLFFALLISISQSCKKDLSNNNAELAKLPPITQTGARTFGCLINGKAILPSGTPYCAIFCDPIFYGDFDFQPNGQFGFVVKYFLGENSLVIGLDSIFTYKNYFINDTINKNVRVSLYSSKSIDSCQYIGNVIGLSNFEKVSGNVNLSRVDVPNGIFSGTFDFTIKTKSCGNYEVTNGRFDYKF